MDYQFITTIATIVLVGAGIAGVILPAIRAVSRSTDARFATIDERFVAADKRFDKIDERFEKVDERFDKIDQRFIRIDERFFEMQKEFTALHAGMARLEGLVEGIRER